MGMGIHFSHLYKRYLRAVAMEQAQMNKAPCKNCERRVAHPNCHSTCQEYKDFVNDRAKYYEHRKERSIIAEYVKQKNKKIGGR